MTVLPSVDLSQPLSESAGSVLTLLTLSAGKPFFIITVLVGLVIGYHAKKTLWHWFTVCSQFMLLLILAFILKSGLKAATEIPRPYTQSLAESGLIESSDAFYLLSESKKAEVINQAGEIYGSVRTSNWLDGTNYAFPSGHTLFAAVFVAFWGGFLLQNKHYLVASIIITWGVSVAISRIYLGMHSYIDLFAAISSIYLFSLLLPTFNRRLHSIRHWVYPHN